jgi:hypothetical protein
VRSHREAVVGATIGAIVALAFIYLLAVNLAGGWKVASDRCSATAPGDPKRLTASSVHSTSIWLPYWECTRRYAGGPVQERSMHVWWP